KPACRSPGRARCGSKPTGTCRSLEITDVDLDGLPDVVASSQWIPGIQWFRNLGGGAFAQSVAISAFAWSMCSADLNGDGAMDLVLQRDGLQWQSNIGGSFGPSVSLTTQPIAAIASLDIEGDGDSDVIGVTSDTLYLFRNDGFGSFSVQTTSFPGWGAVHPLAIADLDADGDPDVIVPTQGGVYWLHNNGTSFVRSTSISAFGFSPLAALDVNGDEIVDLVSAVQNFDVQLGVRLGVGGGNFGDSQTIALPGGTAFSTVAPLDCNQDGLFDFVVPLEDGVRLYRSIGPCSSQPFVRGDSNLDLVVDLADAIRQLEQLFCPATLQCEDASDSNDDGILDISDPVALLAALFLSTPLPGDSACNSDETVDFLDCHQSDCP
ncbi:MAG: VCBS repeat-containing protein, partial [Planctomycetota bacterium]